MAAPLIDSLLQSIAPPRAAEPPRGSGGREAFRPVLDGALQAESRESAEKPDPTDCYPRDAAEDSDGASVDAELQHAEDSNGGDTQDGELTADEHVAEAEAAAETTDEDDDATELDVVEISADGAAEAAAAVVTAPSGPTKVVATETETAAVGTAMAPDAGDENAGLPADGTPTTGAGDAEIEAATAAESAPAARPLTNAPADLSALEAAVAAAKRAAGDAQTESDAAGNDTPIDEAPAAVIKAAQEAAEAAAGKDAAGNDKTKSGSAKATKAKADERDVTADDYGEEAGDARTAKVAATTDAQKVDAAIAAVVDETAAPAAAQATSGDSNATSANGAAPVAAVATNVAEGTTGARGTAAVARLSAERSIHSAAGQTEEIDRARFVGRVEGAIRTAQQRDGRVQVRLSPPELGALRIELTMQNGVLSARLEAETPAARNILLDNLPALRERLAQQDVRIDRFDVDVRRDADGGASSSGQQQSGARDRPAQEPGWRASQQRNDPRHTATAKPQTPARRSDAATDAALDVRV